MCMLLHVLWHICGYFMFPLKTYKFFTIERNHVHMFMRFFVYRKRFRFWYQTTVVMYCTSSLVKNAGWFSREVWSVYKQICISIIFTTSQPSHTPSHNLRIISETAKQMLDAGVENKHMKVFMSWEAQQWQVSDGPEPNMYPVTYLRRWIDAAAP